MHYADNATFIILCGEEMTELVNLVKMASKKLRLGINASKMEVIVMDQAWCLSVLTATRQHEKAHASVYFGFIEADVGSLAEIRRRMALN